MLLFAVRITPYRFFFQAEDGIRDVAVTGVQTCALPILRRTRGGRHKHSLSNPVVHVAPPNAAAPKGQQPDHECRSIPNDDEWHLFPKPSLVQSPNTDEPGHRNAKPRIGSQIRESDSCGGMGESHSQTPWQTLRECKPHMSPRTHVPHHRHPTDSLAEEGAGRIIVWYGLHRVRKQFDFKALLRDQAANQKIIGRLVFNRFVSAKSSKVRTGCNNGRSQCELDSIQLPSN